jgi:hypothetical protein
MPTVFPSRRCFFARLHAPVSDRSSEVLSHPPLRRPRLVRNTASAPPEEMIWTRGGTKWVDIHPGSRLRRTLRADRARHARPERPASVAWCRHRRERVRPKTPAGVSLYAKLSAVALRARRRRAGSLRSARDDPCREARDGTGSAARLFVRAGGALLRSPRCLTSAAHALVAEASRRRTRQNRAYGGRRGAGIRA